MPAGRVRAELAGKAGLFQRLAADYATRGDRIRQAQCRGQALIAGHAVAAIDEAVVEAFDLRHAYEAQLRAAQAAQARSTGRRPARPTASRLSRPVARGPGPGGMRWPSWTRWLTSCTRGFGVRLATPDGQPPHLAVHPSGLPS